ncbi:putative F-box protein [Hordeum vulgare]|uniref:F-box domain-containing protein n=1 Tax=Hordeum vulgare subsp. vulgare TaxID=112509 RepID=A0A8I6YN58_HORVV|nr:probable F-box protein At2g36090 [Hordeum vulgare subsp. vulgare]KAE8814875.1 putative F-box protein [Hordeum vulgare]
MPTTTVEDLPADVLAYALRRLDGPSLAAASCATAGLRALAADPETWRALCLARWPSLGLETSLERSVLASSAAVSPQRLFADAFPFPSTSTSTDAAAAEQRLPGELVSAVDIYQNGASRPLFSRVVETSTLSSWFLSSPFRVDAVECKDPPVRTAEDSASFSPAELELSWIVVDRRSGRAVNVSSRRAVAVDRHWYTGETLVRYAVVLGGSKFEATVTCSEEAGCLSLREVSLTVEDADGAAVSGEGSLQLLAGAMEGPRRKGGEREREEAKRRYEEFVRSKRGRKESKARREVLVDLCCSAVSAVAVLSFLASVVLR